MGRKKNVIAPETKALDKMHADRELADKRWGDGQPFDLVRVETKIGTHNATVIQGMVEVGRNYHWVKAHLNHGEFMAFVERTANSQTYVNNCMKFADLFPEFATVPNLGVRKTRALAQLDKPVVEKYLKGGSLGDIPHDDVAGMTVPELETEVRKLRDKVKRVEAVAKEKLRQKDEQITNLEFENSNRQPPTKEQIVQAELLGLNEEYTYALGEVNSSLRKAFALVAKAEQIKGVNVQQLSDWLSQFDREMETFRELSESWTNEIDNAGPMKDWRLSDLK